MPLHCYHNFANSCNIEYQSVRESISSRRYIMFTNPKKCTYNPTNGGCILVFNKAQIIFIKLNHSIIASFDAYVLK